MYPGIHQLGLWLLIGTNQQPQHQLINAPCIPKEDLTGLMRKKMLCHGHVHTVIGKAVCSR